MHTRLLLVVDGISWIPQRHPSGCSGRVGSRGESSTGCNGVSQRAFFASNAGDYVHTKSLHVLAVWNGVWGINVNTQGMGLILLVEKYVQTLHWPNNESGGDTCASNHCRWKERIRSPLNKTTRCQLPMCVWKVSCASPSLSPSLLFAFSGSLSLSSSFLPMLVSLFFFLSRLFWSVLNYILCYCSTIRGT